MPRGIPKDPNHPRNKKKDASSDAAPKRRGRPPGSKNASAKAHANDAAASALSTLKKDVDSVVTKAVGKTLNRQSQIQIVRDNVSVLAGCQGAEVALNNQIELLMKLTAEELGESETVGEHASVKQNHVHAVHAVTPAPLPTVPNFAPPPFPQS